MRCFIVLFVLLSVSCKNKDIKWDHNLLKKRVVFDSIKAIDKATIILDNNIYVWDYWEPIVYDNIRNLSSSN